MGAAEIISLDEVLARKRWESLRHQLQARFDQWLDRLEEQWPESEPTLAAVTETVWDLRHALTGSLTETLVAHKHQAEYTRQQSHCPQCDRLLTARAPVPRTVQTMVGPVQLERPDFYFRPRPRGGRPPGEDLGFAAERDRSH